MDTTSVDGRFGASNASNVSNVANASNASNVSNTSNIQNTNINSVVQEEANVMQDEANVVQEETSIQDQFVQNRMAHYKFGTSPYNAYSSSKKTVMGFTAAFRWVMAIAITIVFIFTVSSLTKLDALVTDDMNPLEMFKDRAKLFSCCAIIGILLFASNKYNII